MKQGFVSDSISTDLHVGFVDSAKMLMRGSQRLSCELTVMGGTVM
jgi:hypothetical protein